MSAESKQTKRNAANLQGGAAPQGADRVRARRPAPAHPRDPFIRAENEDDDGYDPYSDRRPEPEPLFERDPWD